MSILSSSRCGGLEVEAIRKPGRLIVRKILDSVKKQPYISIQLITTKYYF
jgi:hypothetical protein